MRQSANATKVAWIFLTVAITGYSSAADCDITIPPDGGAGGGGESDEVYCSAQENIAVGDTVCWFEVEGNHSDIILVNWIKSIAMNSYFGFQTQYLPAENLTRIDAVVVGSIDDYADTYNSSPMDGRYFCNGWSTMFEVWISYVNDHAPTFNQETFTINDFPNNFPPRVDIIANYSLNVYAWDNDTRDDFTSMLEFSVMGDYNDTFIATGLSVTNTNLYQVQLFVNATLDPLTTPEYDVLILATDLGNPTRSSTTTVEIKMAVTDKDESLFSLK